MNFIHKKFSKLLITAVVTGAALATSAFAATVTANNNVNVRARASVSSAKVAVLSEGASRTVLGTSGNWVKVKVGGKYGYVSKNHLTTSISKTSVKATDDCNLREKPSVASNILTAVSEGKKVTLTGTSGNWYRVSVDGTSGYIHESNLNTFYSAVVSKAASLVGSRYVYGTAGPKTFDCSGFAQFVYRSCGKSIPRTSSSQYASCKKVSKANLKPGQLVFFSGYSGGGVGHVGIYVGNGNMIHAANSSTGVVKASIHSTYYATRYIGAGYF